MLCLSGARARPSVSQLVSQSVGKSASRQHSGTAANVPANLPGAIILLALHRLNQAPDYWQLDATNAQRITLEVVGELSVLSRKRQLHLAPCPRALLLLRAQN